MNGDEWKPLERLIGPTRCECFMYIGVSKSVLHHGDWEQLRLYKHIDTRRYLIWQKTGPASDIAKAGTRLYRQKLQLSMPSDKAEDKEFRARKGRGKRKGEI